MLLQPENVVLTATRFCHPHYRLSNGRQSGAAGEVIDAGHRGFSFLGAGELPRAAFGMFFESEGQSGQQGVATKDAQHAVELMGEFDGFSGVAAMAGQRRQSDHVRAEGDGVIGVNDALVVQAEAAVEIEAAGQAAEVANRVGGGTGTWAPAAKLRAGDLILTVKGTWTKVTAISSVENEQTVYNFEVEDNHNYFVGPAGVLVHNDVCLFHGTDTASANNIIANGVDGEQAAALGGGDTFWMTTDENAAGWFSQANPAGGDPAVVSISLSESAITGLQEAGSVAIDGGVYQFAPSAWNTLNGIGFSLVP
jgi:hypothetical protein